MTVNDAARLCASYLRQTNTPGKPVSYKDSNGRFLFFVSQSSGSDKEVGQKMLIVNKVTKEVRWKRIRELGSDFLMNETIEL